MRTPCGPISWSYISGRHGLCSSLPVGAHISCNVFHQREDDDGRARARAGLVRFFVKRGPVERGGCFCVRNEIMAEEREDAVGRDCDPGVYLVGCVFGVA